MVGNLVVFIFFFFCDFYDLVTRMNNTGPFYLAIVMDSDFASFVLLVILV